MLRSRLFLSVAAPLAIALAGCAAPQEASKPQPQTVVVAPSTPPPQRVESVPPPPLGIGRYAWQPGHWSWSGADWTWSGGHYVESY